MPYNIYRPEELLERPVGRGLLGLEFPGMESPGSADVNLFYEDFPSGASGSIGTNLEGVVAGATPPFYGSLGFPFLGGNVDIRGRFPVGGYSAEGSIGYQIPLSVLNKLSNPFIPRSLKRKMMGR